MQLEMQLSAIFNWFLECKFEKNSVSKLDHDGKMADLLVKLEKITLIIEIKSDIGSVESKNISSPEKVANMWGRLYEACEQCANSIKANRAISNKIICIVIVADHITVNVSLFSALLTTVAYLKIWA
jgi:hypothetical protein